MATQVATLLYNRLTDEFDARKHLRNGTPIDHLTQVRNQAFEVFKEKGFPSIKEEDWRFTNLVPYLDGQFSLNAFPTSEGQIKPIIEQASIKGLDAYSLVLVNGSIHFAASTLPDDLKVTIKTLKSVSDTDIFKTHNNTNDHVGGNAIVALNTAFFTDGYFLEIAKNAVIDKPIHIIHIYTTDENTFFQPRHLMVVNENAQAEIIETSVAVKENGIVFVNSVSEIVIQDNARLIHYHIQNKKENERWLHYYHVTQQRSSRYDNFTVSLPGADLIRNNLEITLDGTATETHLNGLYLVAGHQLTDNHTSIEHKFPNCNSNEMYKGVLMESGKAVFNGKVFVDRLAQKTNAFQKNNNLLLSEKAQVFTKPQLEIFADDVKCSHGCTVGQFNPESLFYLRSRGIGEDAARKLLVEAFMFDVTEKIENQSVKNYVQALIYEKMGTTPMLEN
jgi:Fe-S cluster assembly protein SufD